MSWAHYLLQVNIYLLVFYGFYRLLLDKETYFTLNRIYLVSAGLLSLAIPYLRFEWFTKQEAIQPVYISVGQLMGQVSIVEEAPDGFNAGNLIVLAYIIGISFFSVRLILRLLSVNRKLKQQEAGAAFSFFRKKRIDQRLPQLKTVHRHEDTHVRQWHSIDVLFFEVLAVFTWFNPIIYFYKNAVKSIHEYLADEEAAKFQGDKEEYALLLLSNAFGVPVHTLTNSFFNKSLIKKRIFMLHKQRSPKMAVLKYGLFIPLFAIALILSSATIRENKKIQEIADTLPLNTPVEVVTEVVKESIKPIASPSLKKYIIQTEGKPQVQPGWQDFYTFIKKHVRYPYAAYRDKVQGSTMVKFTVAGGQLENAGIATKLGGGCDAAVLRSIVLFTNYKAVKDGKYSLKVTFMLSAAQTPMLNKNITPIEGYTALNEISITSVDKAIAGNNSLENDDKVHDFVSIDVQPTFPGGMVKFYEYLKHTVKYPAEAQNNNVQGKVFLSFVVEKNGDLTHITVERKLGSGTDEEAVRILKGSPKWVPGLQDGKPVRVKYHIPINFSLTSSAPLQNKQGSTLPSGNTMGIRFSSDNGETMKFGDKPGNEPLVILDGKTIDIAEMKAMNPNKIESVDILKDAKATAIYGIKGVNGVIVITSKANPAVGVPKK